MYAVIRSGGKQARVAPGDTLRLEKLAGEVGDSVELSDVLMLGEEGEPRVGVRVQLLHDGPDAARGMDILDVDLGPARRHLAEGRRGRGDVVEPIQVVGDLCRVRQRQKVQRGVGRAAHGHVHDEGVVQGLFGDDVERADVLVEASLQSVRRLLCQLDPVGIQFGMWHSRPRL